MNTNIHSYKYTNFRYFHYDTLSVRIYYYFLFFLNFTILSKFQEFSTFFVTFGTIVTKCSNKQNNIINNKHDICFILHNIYAISIEDAILFAYFVSICNLYSRLYKVYSMYIDSKIIFSFSAKHLRFIQTQNALLFLQLCHISIGFHNIFVT